MSDRRRVTRRRLGRTVPVAVLVLAAGIAAGQVLSGEQLPRWVGGGGAVVQDGPETGMQATVGQPAIGGQTGGDSAAELGYWPQARIAVAAPGDAPGPPQRTRLLQNRPNPFNPRTTIRFDLARPGRTTLRVFDLRGREVARLLDEELPAGRHEAVFAPRRLASGIYFYELRHGETREVRRLTLVK